MTIKLSPIEVGTRFGDWTVIAQLEHEDPPRVGFSRVRCVCGTEKDMINNRLRKGHSNGCGCIRGLKLGQSGVTHGKSYTPNYTLWQSVKQRLKYDRRYESVRLYEPWHSNFVAFDAYIETLGPKPTPEHTLDRIDGTRGYEPGNLRWADKTLQSQNRSNAVIERNLEANSKVEVGQVFGRLTVLELVVKCSGDRNWYGARVRCECNTIKTVEQKHLRMGRTKSCGCLKNENEKPIEIDGVSHSMSEWARLRGKSKNVIWERIARGWTQERAIMEPLQEVESVEIGGETMSVFEACKTTGVSYNTAYKRIAMGWDRIQAITEPERKMAPLPLITINGETKTLRALCKELGCSYQAAYSRAKKGATEDQLRDFITGNKTTPSGSAGEESPPESSDDVPLIH